MKNVIALGAAAIAAAAIAAGAMDLGVNILSDDAGDGQLPDRLSVDRSSPFFDPIYRAIGVRFNGEERRGDVQEYCVSEGWMMVRERNVLSGKFKLNSEGGYVLKRIDGLVEPFFKDPAASRPHAPVPIQTQTDDQKQAAPDKAEEKRRRKAAKLARTA